jgi:uncharacterized membrane protein YcaP (DUF421 family)
MDQITPFDLDRMLWGSAPWLFYLEILVRVAVIWFWTIGLLRWIGGRSIAQMSVVEFLLVIALGSAVGDPMFQPDVPLLHAMLVILLIVCADKAVDFVLNRWTKSKRLIDGKPILILQDGQLCMAGLRKLGLGTAEAMEMLRLSGVRNLGQVEHAFLEPSGGLSVFHRDQPIPGLSIVPPLELRAPDQPAPDATPCCASCGRNRTSENRAYPDCGETRVEKATLVDGPSDTSTRAG